VDLAIFDRAHVPNELLQADVAVDEALIDVYEVGSVSLEIATDADVASDERSAGEQRHVAPHLGAGELTACGNVQVPPYLSRVEAGRAGDVLGANARAV
jgi:hypothetical protein